MIDITVTIPDEGRVPDFYANFAAWLKAAPGATQTQGNGLKDWGLHDVQDARYVWGKMSPNARKLFQLLPAGPGSLPWEDLAKALGPHAKADTVGGTFGWPARYAIDVGRTAPTKAGETPHGTVYWLEPAVKALFDKVAAEFE